MTEVYCANYDEKKMQSGAGKALTHFVLLEYYGIDTDTLIMKRTEHGKPYFEGDPIYFNISHSSGVVALAVSDSPVGIDIELKRKVRRAIGERFLGISTDDPDELLRAWVRRESYGKMTGEGFFYDEPTCRHYFHEYRREGAAGHFLISVCSPENHFAKGIVNVHLPQFCSHPPIESELM